MRTLRLDLHTHLKPAKRVAFNPADALQYARTLRDRGLDALAITEHVHAPDFWEMHHAIASRHRCIRGRFEIEGALFYPGFELTLAEVVDVLFIGPVAELRRLDRAFPIRLSDGHHPTGAELLETIHRLDPHLLRIAAHPFRASKRVTRLSHEVQQGLFHAAELNATIACDEDHRLVRRFAEEHALAITGASDSHTWPQLGAAWTDLPVRSDSFDDVFDAVVAGYAAPHVSPEAAALVEAGRALKERIKSEAPRISRSRPITARARVA